MAQRFEHIIPRLSVWAHEPARSLAVSHNLFLLRIPPHLPTQAQGNVGQMAGRNRPVTALNVGHGPLARLDAVQKIPDVRTEQRVGCTLSARLGPQPPLAFPASLR